MDERWTLAELVSEAETRIAALPAPKNGQIRAVPDDRTIRYYGTLGLLDRPIAMRGRTALYGRKHLAQVVAIKRLQTTGSSLAEIQALWPTLDDATLTRMSGIAIAAVEAPRKGRSDFWKAPEEYAPPPPPVADAPSPPPEPPSPIVHPTPQPRAAQAGLRQLEMTPRLREAVARLRALSDLELANLVHEDVRSPDGDTSPPAETPPEVQIELAPGIRIAIAVPAGGLTFSPDDVRALRAAAVPLVELTRRRLPDHDNDDRELREKQSKEGAGR